MLDTSGGQTVNETPSHTFTCGQKDKANTCRFLVNGGPTFQLDVESDPGLLSF